MVKPGSPRDLSHKAGVFDSLRTTHASMPLQLLHYSVIERVKLPVLLATLWATVVWLLTVAGIPLNVGGGAGSLTAILSMVTGLMVSFRSGSSYDRWYEGRRTWASIQSTARTTLRLLVFSLPPPSPTNTRQSAAVHELCSIVCAFSYATMEHLRDRPGVSSPQLRALLPADLLDAYELTPEKVRRNASFDKAVHHSSASEGARAVAGLNLPTSSARAYPWALASGAPTNLPLSLIRTMHAYLNAFHSTPAASEASLNPDTPALDAPTWASCLGSLKEFTDQLTALERVRDTPIPLILSIQQLVKNMGFFSIPATAVAAIVFYGVDRAGEELSDPFGTEPNDLPLERFCTDIHREYLELVGSGIAAGSAGNDWRPTTVTGSTKKDS
ncbi:hypothetical protein MNV49_004008 [Pseudohyphozyma bogoriensis]|nr:hypothetical protein MNV49_004008 [Pseudohyphozyma bogoriensis]